MNIGFVGLGKLGLPCAVAIAEKGHKVYGYDADSKKIEGYEKGISNLYEPDMDKKLKAAKMRFTTSLDLVVSNSDIVFVAVQTPHPPELDGSVRHHHVRKDFDYSYLVKAVKDIAESINYCDGYKTIAIISTVLPGTTRNLIYPAMKKVTRRDFGLCYNPSFIAMGQTIKDYLSPEFALIGEDTKNSHSGDLLTKFYNSIHKAPKLRMSWDEAETVKMIYNTYIGFKIIFGNTIMQICHNTPGADCDVVVNALTLATDRLMNGRYLQGGMGDGGGCHPRDNLALSYLSDNLGLDYNIFDFIMTVREKQTEWIADLACQFPLPKVILGKTYKPGTNLTDGSPSILLANILEERGEQVIFYDPVTDPELPPKGAVVYIVGTMWPEFKDFDFTPGSVVIDPWGIVKDVAGVEVVSVGRSASNG